MASYDPNDGKKSGMEGSSSMPLDGNSLIFPLEISGISVEWFAFRKFNNFGILHKFSQEISVPRFKIPDFLVEWKALLVFCTYLALQATNPINKRYVKLHFQSIHKVQFILCASFHPI